MESIRRRFKSTGDPWDLDSSLETGSQETSEFPLENTVLLTQSPTPGSNDVDLRTYYKGLIATAMTHGGWYQGHQISIPWLRMTLAGLDMRPMPAEMMWEGVQTGEYPDPSEYREFFPEEKLGI